MELLPSKQLSNAFTTEELDLLIHNIDLVSAEYSIVSSQERYKGAVTDKHYEFDYYSEESQEIRKIIDPKLQELLQDDSRVTSSFILYSIKPILIHTDYVQFDGEPTPTYTVIIPLENYDSKTVIFNEAQEYSNELEDYKKTHSRSDNLSRDAEFFRTYLTHIHPNDIKYLSLKEFFQWDKGSMFAFDRRHFHCSDNYIRNGENGKKAIVLFFGKE